MQKNLKKFPDLQTWLPELAERFEPMEDFTHDEIETVVKDFTEEKGAKLGVIMNGATSSFNRFSRRTFDARGF